MDKNNIYYGKEDYEEDDDVYSAFNVDSKIFKEQKVTEFSGFNKNPLAENSNADKIRLKIKKIVEKSEKVEESSAEFKVRTFMERLSVVSPAGSGVRAPSEPGSPPGTAEERRTNQHAAFIKPQIRFQPQMNPMLQQNVFNNLSGPRFITENPYILLNHLNMLNNQQRFPVTQPPVEQTPNNSYSITSTYSYRLIVVDSLFKFIMQILQTPDPPSLQQIDFIKKMLDSMVQQNYINIPWSMK